MSDIVERLRGVYRIPITDGLGPAGGEEPNNPHEHVRTFQTPPIQHQAAAEIERLRADNARLREALGKVVRAHDSYMDAVQDQVAAGNMRTDPLGEAVEAARAALDAAP